MIIVNGPAQGTNYRADAMLLRPMSVGRMVEQVESPLRLREKESGAVRCQFGALSLDPASARLANREASVRLGVPQHGC